MFSKVLQIMRRKEVIIFLFLSWNDIFLINLENSNDHDHDHFHFLDIINPRYFKTYFDFRKQLLLKIWLFFSQLQFFNKELIFIFQDEIEGTKLCYFISLFVFILPIKFNIINMYEYKPFHVIMSSKAGYDSMKLKKIKGNIHKFYILLFKIMSQSLLIFIP